MSDGGGGKVLSALAHGSIFFSSTLVSIGVPILIIMAVNDATVKQNAIEAINLHLNLYLWLVVGLLLSVCMVGIPVIMVVLLASWVLPVIAVISVLTGNDVYRYPVITRFI